MTTLRRRLIDYGLASLAILIPVLMLRASLADPADLSRFDRAVLRISSPLQRSASWLVEGLGSSWNGYVALVDIEDENDELRRENYRLSVELAAAKRLAGDAELAERLIGLKSRTVAETVGARIVAAQTNSFFKVARIRLDRGSSEVRVGLPVIDEVGLIGRIGRVYGDYSEVTLLSDPASSIAVILPRSGAQGVLTGTGQDDSYACRIEYLDRDKAVEEGDLVVTSGLGGELPAGIPVGTIAAVTTKEYGRYQEVEVGPAVDLGSLEIVLVLLSPPPSPDPDGGRDKVSQVAAGVRPF